MKQIPSLEKEKNITVFDEKAFEKVFKSHFKDMVFFAQKYVKDSDSAREIAHEAFISLWEKRETIDPSRTIKAYLGSSVHNKCMNYLRENKKFSSILLTCEHLIHEPSNVSDAMMDDETAKIVEMAMNELTEKCREIFKMSRFEHKKYHEIADELGISIKTVETQMSKSLQHLRARLANYLEFLLIVALFYLN